LAAARRSRKRLAGNLAESEFPEDSIAFCDDTKTMAEIANPSQASPWLAYLSLGSNLGDRAANLREAIRLLQEAVAVRKVSAFYETQPVDVPDQPWFLNCVLALETGKTPRELLQFVLETEHKMGRLRMRDKGPRTIDIDILLFDDRIIDEPGLKVPHPALCQRRFVLEPLAEIAPDVRDPATGKIARELLASLPPGQTVRKLDERSASGAQC
jgi:2-amino-4-hydroxy-6-hydroxymethyldihydropteridine diphosphokinase